MNNILANILQFTGDSIPVEKKVSSKSPFEWSKGIAVVCFSKERPFQLHQLLLSMECCFDTWPAHVIVLYCPGVFQREYDLVFQAHTKVTAVLETDFEHDLVEELNRMQSVVEHTMFCVDDLVFTRKFSPMVFASTLNQDPTLFSMHVKLHPGIVYAHSGNKVCLPPKLYAARQPSPHKHAENLLYLSFYLAQGASEWRYPFDLCASIYRLADVLLMVKLVQRDQTYESKSLSNPNKLEFTGNKVFWNSQELRGKYFKCACSSVPLACVVTVNRVQSTYDVPIYQNSMGDIQVLNRLLHCHESADGQDSDGGDNKYNCCVQFDFVQYSTLTNLSVHIGDLFLTTPPRLCPSPMHLTEYHVCVLLPVYNGAKFLSECLRSLIDIAQGCPFEILLVDDGSTDETISIADEWTERCECSSVNKVRLTIVRLSHQGLSSALDCGLQHTSCPFVARMDADDVCEPHRLDRQLQYLRNNPTIHVLGGQAVLFTGDDCAGCASAYLAHNMPTHPLLLQWEMSFRCALIHPTVMMRREAILECGAYTASSRDDEHEKKFVSFVEDYWLWSRVLQRYPFSIAALPDVVLNLRRHSLSKSRQEAQLSKLATADLRSYHLKQFMQDTDSDTLAAMIEPSVHLLREEQLPAAMRLLEALFHWCTGTYSEMRQNTPKTTGDLVVFDRQSDVELHLPMISQAVEDNSVDAAKCVLAHYFNNRKEQILLASKRFVSSEYSQVGPCENPELEGLKKFLVNQSNAKQ